MPTSPHDAGSYAAALVNLGTAAGMLHRLESEAREILDWLEDTGEARQFLSDPRVSDEGKRAALENLLGTRIHRLLLDFFILLINQGMASGLCDVARAFLSQADSLRKEVSGEVVTARELSRDRVAAIEKEIGRLTGKTVRLQPRVSEEILGGVYVRVGSLVFDGTIDRRLEQHRKTLGAP